MRQDQKPRVIQMNDDSVAFYRYCTTERPTVKALEDMVDIFARANIDTLTQCVHCRWQAYYDSSVVEIAGDLTPDAVRPWEAGHYWHWMTSLRQFIADGHDPLKVIAERCHHHGMRFLPSFRLNDQHGMHPHEGHYGSFRRDHPEWMVTDKAMDYGVSEVRQHILKVARELVQYDIDGIDLDFMRWPVYFKKDEVKANTPVMTEFVRDIRSILDEAAKERDGSLLLSVRVPLKIGDGTVINPHALSPDLECLGIGLDVPTWVKEGMVDMVCPMNFFFTAWPVAMENIHQWRELTAGTGCGLYPTIHSMAFQDYEPPYISAESYCGAAYSFYTHGADGITLYNLWDNNEVAWSALKELGMPIALSTQPRRYHCYLGGLIPISKGGRKTLAFYLPEGPRDSSTQATLKFTATNLTLDHSFEVDINGTPIASSTLHFKRMAPGSRADTEGAPELPYSHTVEFPLSETQAAKGENVLGIRLTEINTELPSKKTIEVGRVEVSFQPR